MGSRGAISRSTPPSGSIRARMESTSVFARGACAESAACRMSRASSSIDRPRFAARTRNRALIESSMSRIVMLAIAKVPNLSMIAFSSLMATQAAATRAIGRALLPQRRSGCGSSTGCCSLWWGPVPLIIGSAARPANYVSTPHSPHPTREPMKEAENKCLLTWKGS